MAVRARASSVIVHRVAAEGRDAFLAWQAAIAEAASTFAGYQDTDLYPPHERRDPWVIVVHYDDDASLQAWLRSDVRAEHVARFREASPASEFEVKELPSGLGGYFAQAPAPSWKMNLTVLCGLYPTVVLLGKGVGPFTSPLGFAISLLIGNLLSVWLLDWFVMPAVTRALGPWLRARTPRGSATGLVAVAAALAGMTVVFRALWG